MLSFNFSRGLQDQLFDWKYDSPHEIQLHKFCNSFDEVEINKKTERTEVDHQPRTVVESSSSSMISNNSQSLKVFTIEKIQKFSKVKDFSNRQDVINKAALRKMRKYYSDMFKSANKKLVRLRFCNSKSSEIMRAAKSILKNEFGEEADIDELCYYLIGILKIKSLWRIHWNENIKQEVNQYLDWVRNYSKNKFDKIFKSESLKRLWANFKSKACTDERFEYPI